MNARIRNVFLFIILARGEGEFYATPIKGPEFWTSIYMPSLEKSIKSALTFVYSFYPSIPRFFLLDIC